MRELALEAEKSGNDNGKYHYFEQMRQVAKHLRRVSMQNYNEACDIIFTATSQLPLDYHNTKAANVS
jgi:hypothetical protein